MFGQQQLNGDGSGSSNTGVQICVEPLTEWKIQEIGYDGIEKYIKPQEFKDVLRKNSRRINWRKIVGNDATLDNGDRVDDGGASDSDENDEFAGVKSQERRQLSPAVADGAEKQQSSSKSNFYEPAAGPWASVGKHLHNALQELHVLLDALRITSSDLYYLNPVVNAPMQQDERSETEQISQSKIYQLSIRKKSIMEAARLIERMMKHRQQIAAESCEESNFTKELRQLRENWRIRKVGPNIFGDLGYKTYVPKFAPNELFDVIQKTVAARRDAALRFSNPSYIGIRLAHHLRRRTQLIVSIQPDGESVAKKFYDSSTCALPAMGNGGSEDEIKHIHWKRALPWAQDSLICRDILAQLVTESVSQHDLISISTEHSILLSLFDNMLLLVELRYHPFQDMPLPPTKGSAYLGQLLRELYMAEHTKRPKRNQQFVTLPQTSLPESLDMRGPQALPTKEISARIKSSDPLIRRFFGYASHYLLVERIAHFLADYLARFTDPQPQWKWVRATSSFTLVSLSFINRGFEHLGKFSSHIRISQCAVTLLSKDSQQIACRRDMDTLMEALLLLTANFLLNTLNNLSRAYVWQILHANVNAFDANGNPAPTFYACNQTATKNLFIQFHTDGQPPAIFLKDSSKKQKSAEQQPQSADDDVDLDGFCRLNYQRLPGSTFMRKMDNLLVTFIS